MNDINHIEAMRIIDAVCLASGVGPMELRGATRPNRTAHPRMIAMAMIRRRTDLTLHEIGRIFNRDHACVCNAQKRLSAIIRDRPHLARIINDAEQILWKAIKEPVLFES